MKRPFLLVACLAVSAVLAGCSSSSTKAPSTQAVVSDAVDTYLYGSSLVTMDMTRKQTTNVDSAGPERAPMGQFARMRTFPTAAYRDVPGANTDTLYTMAWLDVSKEPWVLSIPDMGDRYYMMPMLDGWTNVFQSPGTRTTGDKAQKYAITGPGWSGTLPKDVTEYKSPTGLVWILGRIYCAGTQEDYAKVHALQDRFSVVPLSSYGKPYNPPPAEVDTNLDMKTPTPAQIQALSLNDYFSYLAKLLKTNPPAAQDNRILARMAKIGLVPGHDFDASKLSFDKEALNAVPKSAVMKMLKRVQEQQPTNGWLIFGSNVAKWDTDYLLRATTAWLGPGWNLPADAVYPLSQKDANGNDYNGAEHKYVLRFDKGEFPPVKGFWSLTVYDENNFLAANPLHRYTLSQRDKFVTNPDGSVDLYLQADSPGKAKEANWLPAPKSKFGVMLRLYWPTDTPPSIIDGTWKPPAIKVVQ
ncbi:MAG TPA: DUF1254 domain-containing protein [Candidatus Sulfotelmatobacter sp.]|nr:DUF1254 domain-containing protein [Candidatus Sulfotelmatobacter sp.]